MAKTILICGKTGTGKTTSIRTLNPEETVILCSINRTLPFKYGGKYVPNKNLFQTPTYDKVIKALKWANAKPEVKNIVLTDTTYISRQEFFSRIKETGYNKFSELAIHMQQIILAVQNMRDDMKVFIEFHVENVEGDSGVVEYKASTVGKLLDDKYNIFENVDIILFASPTYEDKNVTYGFYTNKTIDRIGSEIPAKTPMEMFDELYIPNDLQLVADKIDAYYSE